MGCEMKLTSSQQMYVQAIDLLQQEQNRVCQIDIAVYLGYSRASVCRAVKRLSSAGLIVVENHTISLSAAGRGEADRLRYVRQAMLAALTAYDCQKPLDMKAVLQLPACWQVVNTFVTSGHTGERSAIIKQTK